MLIFLLRLAREFWIFGKYSDLEELRKDPRRLFSGLFWAVFYMVIRDTYFKYVEDFPSQKNPMIINPTYT